MRSSYKILKVFGISVELHITFLMLLLGFFALGWLSDGFVSGVQTLLFFVIIFTIVVMHELSHSIVALLSGIKVKKITLLPIGGVASIDIPENPVIELVMSIAGPFLNFVMAFVCIILLLLTVQNPEDIYAMSQSVGDPSMIFSFSGLLVLLVYVNMMLGLFNLLPAFPMDGGRVFRSILALFMDYTRATRIAVNVGRVLAVVMVFVGILWNPWLLLIGALIFFVGGQEYQVVSMKHSLGDLTVAQIAIPKMDYVNGNLSLREFLALIAKPGREFYPVVNDGRAVMGVLRLDDLQSLRKEDLEVPVGRFVRKPDIVDGNRRAEDAVTDLMTKDFVLVVDSKNVVGYLTPGRLNEIVRFHNILKA